MTFSDIIQSKTFIICAAGFAVGYLLYLSGLWGILKKVVYDCAFNHNTQHYDINNIGRICILAVIVYLLLATHVRIMLNPFRFEYEKMNEWLVMGSYAYIIGEGFFKFWMNRGPAQPDNKIEVTSETTTISPAPVNTLASVKKPNQKKEADTVPPLDSEVIKSETKPDKG